MATNLINCKLIQKPSTNTLKTKLQEHKSKHKDMLQMLEGLDRLKA